MPRADGPADKTIEPVFDFAEFEIRGASKLVRTDTGVSAELVTTGLPAGAYTCWFVVFNNPEQCALYDELGPGSCGLELSDFLPASEGGTTGFGFAFADGKIVDESGMATFGGHLKQGDVLMNDFLELDEVLEDPRTAEIHLIVRYHGPAEPGRIYEQTHTLEPELGLEADLQFSVHAAP